MDGKETPWSNESGPPPTGSITNSTISVGSFTPTPESAEAVARLADAIKANADAIAACARMLTPPRMDNAVGVKIGGK